VNALSFEPGFHRLHGDLTPPPTIPGKGGGRLAGNPRHRRLEEQERRSCRRHDAPWTTGRRGRSSSGRATTLRPQGRSLIATTTSPTPRRASAKRSSRGSRRSRQTRQGRAHSSCSRTGRCSIHAAMGWATRDGAQAIDLLMPLQERCGMFYGHIHQEHHHMTGHIAHHSAKSPPYLPADRARSKPKARTRALGSGTALQRARFPRGRRRSTEGRFEPVCSQLSRNCATMASSQGRASPRSRRRNGKRAARPPAHVLGVVIVARQPARKIERRVQMRQPRVPRIAACVRSRLHSRHGVDRPHDSAAPHAVTRIVPTSSVALAAKVCRRRSRSRLSCPVRGVPRATWPGAMSVRTLKSGR